MKYLLLFLALTSFASWPIDRVKIVTEDLPPLSYKNSDGEVIGAATTRVKELMAQAEIDYDIAILPWKRALKRTLEQPNTLIYTILKTPQREQNFEWFCPIAPPLKIFLYSLPDNSKVALQSIDDAKSALVGVSRGSVAHGILLSKGFKEDHNLIVTNGMDVLKRNLQNGRLDYILVIDTAVDDMTNITKALPNSFSKNYIPCLALNKNSDEDIKQRLRVAFAKLPAISN
ncbi:substrate-binding periplasmic protein [Pseudoalteromonas sp. GB56]